MQQRIGITGATGYVGTQLVQALQLAGHEVITLVRSPGAENARAWSLLDGAKADSLRNLDVLIHCAWDMRLRSAHEVRAINVNGSRRLLNEAQAAGVKRLVFISSMSAYSGCRSVYGQAKLAVEETVLAAGGICIRPGLVYSDVPGGITGALLQLARRSPLLPMVGWGRFRLHPCHASDLAQLVLLSVSAPLAALPRLITAAAEEGVAFRDIVTALAKRRLYFLPLPWSLLWAGLRLAESLGMQLRFKSDSLLGLVYSDPDPDFGPLRQLGLRFRSLPATPD